jgi:hypothetical protein
VRTDNAPVESQAATCGGALHVALGGGQEAGRVSGWETVISAQLMRDEPS